MSIQAFEFKIESPDTEINFQRNVKFLKYRFSFFNVNTSTRTKINFIFPSHARLNTRARLRESNTPQYIAFSFVTASASGNDSFYYNRLPDVWDNVLSFPENVNSTRLEIRDESGSLFSTISPSNPAYLTLEVYEPTIL